MAEDVLHIKEDVAVMRDVEWERDFAQEGADTGSSLTGQRAASTDIDNQWEEQHDHQRFVQAIDPERAIEVRKQEDSHHEQACPQETTPDTDQAINAEERQATKEREKQQIK